MKKLPFAGSKIPPEKAAPLQKQIKPSLEIPSKPYIPHKEGIIMLVPTFIVLSGLRNCEGKRQ
jgi:hypothetical protein